MMKQPLTAQRISVSNKFARALWNITWFIFFQTSPRFAHKWRWVLLRLFGAKMHKSAKVYPTAKVWAPWNLIMNKNATIGEHVDCYCVNKVEIGNNTTISQFSVLCTASHDFSSSEMHLISGPIIIGSNCWITYGCFISPGIIIEDNAVIYPRSVVVKNVGENNIIGGNPAIFIKDRASK